MNPIDKEKVISLKESLEDFTGKDHSFLEKWAEDENTEQITITIKEVKKK